jgi:mRNA interferase RelE/StbE
MEYHLEILPEAGRSISKLDRQIAKRILRKLAWLVENIAAVEHVGLHGPLAGSFKLREGDHRIVYDIDHQEQIVTVRQIGHRSEIYKG